ncbi:hypothetical protein B5G38_03145 [Gemmiger sp. An87]|nr:hypothetical protein B5G38_03145 [Gemmiger sp. An87]
MNRGVRRKKEMDIAKFCADVLKIGDSGLIEKLDTCAEIERLKKGAVVIRAGEIPTKIGFLLEGSFRGYTVDVEGREITDCLSNQCGFPLVASFAIDVPAFVTIEMLEDSRVVYFPGQEIMDLMQEYPSALDCYNRLLINSLKYHWTIKTLLHQYTAMERYRWFLQEYPGMIERVNNRYIASFLGMNAVTMSRLRREIRERGNNYDADIVVL